MSDPSPSLTQEHTLVLRSIPSSVPEEIRLRRALKCLLRSFGFRLTDYNCVDVPVQKAAPASRAGPR